MPRVDETPEELRPYIFHGVDLQWKKNDKNAVGPCPFCGGENTFNVKIETSEWKCWSCSNGNKHTFVRKLLETGRSQTTDREYEVLREERGFVTVELLKEFGFVKSPLTGDWLIPAGKNKEGEPMTAYRWVYGKVLPTPTMGAHLFGMVSKLKEAESVFICEGPWDAYALFEMFSQCRYENDSFLESDQSTFINEESICVLGVPGANNFKEKWLKWFSGKIVTLMLDNDHPRNRCKDCKKTYSALTEESCPHCGCVEVTGTGVPPAGIMGVKKLTSILSGSDAPPEEIYYLQWGDEGYDKDLVSGTDVRDFLNG